MIWWLLALVCIPPYLLAGTFYARATSVYCYQKSRQFDSIGLADDSYNTMIVARVLAWPFIWATLLIARTAKAPVHSRIAAVDKAATEMRTWRDAMYSGDTPADQNLAYDLYKMAQQDHRQAQRALKELEQ